MKITTLITTYNRPKLCFSLILNLIVDINSSKLDADHHFIIADDGSDPPYWERIQMWLKANEIKYEIVLHPTNNGKQGYWHVIADLYHRLKKLDYDYVIQLPDDVKPCARFYESALESLKVLGERKVLNLLRDHRDSEWGGPEPLSMVIKGVALRRTGWMDMCYIADRPAMEALDYDVYPVMRDWQRQPQLGSGVAPQLSRRWRVLGVDQWQVERSLVIHSGDEPSVMNQNRPHKLKSI